MDEVFGSENFVSLIAFRTTANLVGNYLGRNSDYILFYAHEIQKLKYRQIYRTRTLADDIGGRYTRTELTDGSRRVMSEQKRSDVSLLPKGSRVYRHDNLTSQGPTDTGTVPFSFQGNTFHPGSSRHWTTATAGLERLSRADRLAAPTPNSLTYIRYLDDFSVGEFTAVWTDTQTGAFTDDKVYVVQTNTKVIERCLLMTTDPGDLVIDPTCGSGTTAYVAEQWGRRWITIDTSRVALTLARTRLMAARFPYYLLADSPEGIQKEAEIAGQPSTSVSKAEGDVRKGFVYKRVPHVTLKAIANNEDIDAIHAEWQERLEPILAKLNKINKEKWEEWEVPREPEKDWSKEAISLLKEWWNLRQQRQAEIDASIARRAETERLVDQPYDDNKRVRVAGPFTVESLSPHRTISVEEKNRLAEVGDAASGLKIKSSGPDQFAAMILENLCTAGVQNTIKKERLRFDCLQPYAGQWIHGEGTYTDSDAKHKRVAVCIGPEHGTVSPQLVKEAAKEAVQGVGFDLLIVCGFAFDPHVSEEAKRYGKLVVLPTHMNPDLTMGELLEEDRFWQPLHGLWRAGPRCSQTERRADCRNNQRAGHLRPHDRRNPLQQHRQHCLLVPGYELQRGEFLRPPRLLYGGG